MAPKPIPPTLSSYADAVARTSLALIVRETRPEDEPRRVEAELPSTFEAVTLSPRQPFPDPGVLVEARYVIGSNDFKAVHGVEF